MSIVSLSRVTLCGSSTDKKALLAGLQRLGCMHLVSLQPPPKEPEKTPPERAEDAYRALRYLLDVRSKRRQVTDAEHFDFNAVVQQALANQQRRRDTEDRRDFLARRIEELRPWGHFEFPAEGLGGYRLWFYQVRHDQMQPIRELELPWQVVHKDNRFAYVAVIAKQEPPRHIVPVARTHTGAVPLNQLKRELQGTEIELEDLYAEHQALSRWIFLLTQNLARAEDKAALTYASTQLLESDGICAVQGWLPARDLARMRAFADDLGLALLAEPPRPDETPPTLLENPEPVSGGQDLVSFYQTPGYHSWDPSPVVFLSFALFFAMILADAGYALALTTVLAFFWNRLSGTGAGTRFRQLSVVVLSASVVYGVLVGSYFGFSPSEGSLLARLKVLELDNFDVMMRLSILIGCLHLIMANAAVAYRLGRFPENAPQLGWIAVILGGLLLWLGTGGTGNPTLETAGGALLALGLVLVLVFSGKRKVNSVKAFFLRLSEGLMSVTNVTKMFGDVLSYLRLFALGLASSSLAVTFNQLAVDVRDALPGVGLLLSILVLLLGHIINLALGIVSGFVHGLRLNFIEFFSWGISEEGYPFRAFAKKEIEHE